MDFLSEFLSRVVRGRISFSNLEGVVRSLPVTLSWQVGVRFRGRGKQTFGHGASTPHTLDRRLVATFSVPWCSGLQLLDLPNCVIDLGIELLFMFVCAFLVQFPCAGGVIFFPQHSCRGYCSDLRLREEKNG